MKVIQNALLYNKIDVTTKDTKKSLFLSERLYSLLEILKIYKVHLLDCGREQQINFLPSTCWETIDFNVTCLLNTIFLFSESHNL